MVGELNLLSEWIPEQMSPGTLFVLENAGEMGEQRQGEEPVRDGHLPRRELGGLLRVDVDELVVDRDVGELVDPLLRHLEPLADALGLADR